MIDKLSEPAKRVFSFFGLSFPTPDVKEGKRDGKKKKRKTQQKERVKRSPSQKDKKERTSEKRGSLLREIKVELPLLSERKLKILAQILQSMLLGTTMSEETYEE